MSSLFSTIPINTNLFQKYLLNLSHQGKDWFIFVVFWCLLQMYCHDDDFSSNNLYNAFVLLMNAIKHTRPSSNLFDLRFLPLIYEPCYERFIHHRSQTIPSFIRIITLIVDEKKTSVDALINSIRNVWIFSFMKVYIEHKRALIESFKTHGNYYNCTYDFYQMFDESIERWKMGVYPTDIVPDGEDPIKIIQQF
jgi:hypothetical protein